MGIAIVFLGLPLVFYLVLVMMPRGRGWTITCAVAMLLIGYIWLGYMFSWEPLWTGSTRADAYTVAAANLYTIAAVAGGITGFFGRKLAARYEVLTYPLIAVGVLVILFTPLFIILGV